MRSNLDEFHRIDDPAHALVGREGLIRDWWPIVVENPIVTLVGPPGVGKTSLARELARRGASRAHMHTWWCDVRNAQSVADVAWTIARTSGIEIGADQRVGRAVAPQGECLIVLDNCEQVPELESALAKWSSNAPEARWLMTSRRPLGIESGQVLEVPALDLEESVELLAALSRPARNDTWDPAIDRQGLEELAEALDGLPLALELAAARATILSPREVLRYAMESLRVLEKAAHSTGVHASLVASLEASWARLSQSARDLFLAVCVFEEDFDLEAARAVCELQGGLAATIDALDELSTHNLIERARHPGRTSFRLLQTLRVFGIDKLREVGELENARARRLRVLEARIDRWLQATETEDLPSIWDDVRAHAEVLRRLFHQTVETRPELALKVLRVLSPHVRMQGPRELHPTLAWDLERHIASLPDSASRAQAHAELFIACTIVKNAADALRHASAMTQEAQACGHEAVCAEARLMLAQALVDTGDLDGAKEEIEAALDKLPLRDRPSLEVRILQQASRIALYAGERQLALDRIAQAHECSHRLDAISQADAQREQGALYAMLGRMEEAVGELRRAVDSLEQIPNHHALLWTHLFLAYIELTLEMDDEATQDARRALALAQRVGAVDTVRARCETVCAWTDLFNGEREAGIERLERASFLTSAHHASTDDGEERALMASIQWLDGQVDEALENMRKALDRTVYPPLKFIRKCFLLGLLTEAQRLAEAAELGEELSEEKADQPEALQALASLFLRVHEGEPFELPVAERSRLHELIRTSDHGLFVRLAVLILEQRADEPSATLVVDPDGLWFELEGARVDLSRRGPMRSLLVALVEHRLDHEAHEPLTAYELFEKGWPGQEIEPELATARVYNSIKTLRNLGLADAITSTYHGYRLDPDLRVTWA